MATRQMRNWFGVARVGGVPGPELILPPGHRFTRGPAPIWPSSPVRTCARLPSPGLRGAPKSLVCPHGRGG
jgi:hypothetical protein